MFAHAAALGPQPLYRMEILMTVNTIASLAADAARGHRCPLCATSAGQPCQPKPAGDHLARYLDAYTAGQVSRGYMTLVLGDLIVIDACAVITAPQPALAEAAAYDWCPATTELDDETLYCDRDAGHAGSHHAPGPDEGSEVAWSDCDADWGSATASQRCTLELGHDGPHRDRAGHEWDDPEPYCSTCGATVGLFLGYDGWHHFRGEGTPENRTELYDAGHEPAVAWREAGAL